MLHRLESTRPPAARVGSEHPTYQKGLGYDKGSLGLQQMPPVQLIGIGDPLYYFGCQAELGNVRWETYPHMPHRMAGFIKLCIGPRARIPGILPLNSAVSHLLQ